MRKISTLSRLPTTRQRRTKRSRAQAPEVPEKTLIGVLASHDGKKANESLVSLLTHLYNGPNRQLLESFHFVFTGGTYDRVFFGDEKLAVSALDERTTIWLKTRCGATRLPSSDDGGVIVLSHLITQRKCSIVWPFYAPNASHWQRNENLAFMRLSDQWHVKRLMNRGSVLAWFDWEADVDANRNLQSCPPSLSLEVRPEKFKTIKFSEATEGRPWRGPSRATLTPRAKSFTDMTVALIAHDEMKSGMIEFAIDHEAELVKFKTILATGTTGREVAAATSRKIDKQMVRYHSGPKGGDIEIATMILYGHCDVVIFFVDPLRAHAHIEDIRVVFQACMFADQVVIITNEMHAREFMARVVRGNDSLTFYEERTGNV